MNNPDARPPASTTLIGMPGTIEDAKRALYGSGWQPIETAPKDYTFVVVWCAGASEGFQLNVARWRPDHGRWCLNFYNEPIEDQPTHWMPLNPPKPG